MVSVCDGGVVFCVWCLFAKWFRMSVSAPSPVTLHAVPKESCRAKIVMMSAVPDVSNPKMDTTIPRDAMTVPPGTPGAPMASIPKRSMNVVSAAGEGRCP